MKKILSYIVFTILAMHTTVSFSNAEETADFNSAPVIQQTVP